MPPIVVTPTGNPLNSPTATSTDGSPTHLSLLGMFVDTGGPACTWMSFTFGNRRLHHVRANAYREVSEPAERAALPERRIAAGDPRADLHVHVVEQVRDFLAGIAALMRRRRRCSGRCSANRSTGLEVRRRCRARMRRGACGNECPSGLLKRYAKMTAPVPRRVSPRAHAGTPAAAA